MPFTATDLANIDAAMVSLAVDGVASVTVGGQTVTTHSLDALRRLRETVAGDVVVDAEVSHGGMRIRQLVPPGCG